MMLQAKDASLEGRDNVTKGTVDISRGWIVEDDSG